MGSFQEKGQKICYGLAIATDWLLICMGFLLILIALKSVDVMVARYVVISGGVVLTGIGFWYRYRRLKRKRKQPGKSVT
jgi:uncharacterized membrane-anchored protein